MQEILQTRYYCNSQPIKIRKFKKHDQSWSEVHIYSFIIIPSTQETEAGESL